MVFYFTGTGNCLYIAKQLEAQPVSIPQVIHQENLHFCDKSIGIVAPVYGHEVPVMVKEFLHKATFDTDYFYMILTYGNRHGGAAELAAQMENLDSYDIIFLGYPNWNADLPMPLYTLLEQTDLSGKTIVPFTTHGGSGFSRNHPDHPGAAAQRDGCQRRTFHLQKQRSPDGRRCGKLGVGAGPDRLIASNRSKRNGGKTR